MRSLPLALTTSSPPSASTARLSSDGASPPPPCDRPVAAPELRRHLTSSSAPRPSYDGIPTSAAFASPTLVVLLLHCCGESIPLCLLGSSSCSNRGVLLAVQHC